MNNIQVEAACKTAFGRTMFWRQKFLTEWPNMQTEGIFQFGGRIFQEELLKAFNGSKTDIADIKVGDKLIEVKINANGGLPNANGTSKTGAERPTHLLCVDWQCRSEGARGGRNGNKILDPKNCYIQAIRFSTHPADKTEVWDYNNANRNANNIKKSFFKSMAIIYSKGK